MSRVYQLRKLEEAERVIAHRWGKRCGRACDAPIVYIVRSIRQLHPRARGASRTWYLCQEHAKQFAATHLIEAFVK